MVRTPPEHESEHGGEVGGGGEAPERAGAQAAVRREEARPRCAGLAFRIDEPPSARARRRGRSFAIAYRGLNYADPYGLCPGTNSPGESCAQALANWGASTGRGWAVNAGATLAVVGAAVDAVLGGGGCGQSVSCGTVPFSPAGAGAAPQGVNAASRSVNFLVASSGATIRVPAGATGPTPTQASGFQFLGGSGGNGLNPRVTGVRVMEPNATQGRRAVYMNVQGQTVSPATGRTVAPNDPAAHHPVP